MVEYALLLAGTSLGSLTSIAASFMNWASDLNWTVVSYALLGLVALRIAVWAFRQDS